MKVKRVHAFGGLLWMREGKKSIVFFFLMSERTSPSSGGGGGGVEGYV